MLCSSCLHKETTCCQRCGQHIWPDSNARQIFRLVNNGEERACCKYDGSLNEGFEIVSYPMTIDYHCQHIPWKEVLDKAVCLVLLFRMFCYYSE